MVAVDIGGYSPPTVLDVSDEAVRGDELGLVEIQLVNTASNRSNIESGDDVTVTRDGTDVMSGYVTAKESDGSTDTLRVEAMAKRLELTHEQLHTVFYNRESSSAVTTAITTRSRSLPLTEIHVGSSTTDWRATAPVFQLYDGTRAGLYNWGTDLLFVGARKGHDEALEVTFDAVPPNASEDGIFELQTRLLINNVGGVFSFEVEFVTLDGTSYLWQPEIPGTGFHTYTLKAEAATPGDGLNGTLRYRFDIAGELGQNTGIFIDSAHTIPFRRESRTTDLSTSGVKSTGRDITRRVDENVASFISTLALEDRVNWWVDPTDVLHYGGGGSRRTDRAIDDSSPPPVLRPEIDRDYESIRNKVTVQGADDIEVTVQDASSIVFYGVNARTEPIQDKELHSEAEARARAEGYLDKHAWEDAIATFPVVDESYSDLTPGERISVTWSEADLDGTFTVDSVATNTAGVVEVTIGASSGSST